MLEHPSSEHAKVPFAKLQQAAELIANSSRVNLDATRSLVRNGSLYVALAVSKSAASVVEVGNPYSNSLAELFIKRVEALISPDTITTSMFFGCPTPANLDG